MGHQRCPNPLYANAFWLEVLCHIADKFSSANINNLYLHIFFCNAEGDEETDAREVIAFHCGLFIIDAALLAFLLFIEFFQKLFCLLP